MTDRRLLLVHAHPDDEAINNAATMAKYVAGGAGVTLVTCTLGELGEVLDPQYAGLSAERGDQLGGYRISELKEAMAILGVTDHRFLGGAGRWRDSGMMGTPGNDDPRAFWACGADPVRFDEAVDSLVEIIAEVRPQVLVTYNDNGGYGHPDHIMAHRVAMAAAARAAAPGPTSWAIAKIYHNATSRRRLQRLIDIAVAAGDPSPFGVDRADELPFGDDDDAITTVIDGREFAAAKISSLRVYRTQIADDAPFFTSGRYGDERLLGIEDYRLVQGSLGRSTDADGRESDLFEGVGP